MRVGAGALVGATAGASLRAARSRPAVATPRAPGSGGAVLLVAALLALAATAIAGAAHAAEAQGVARARELGIHLPGTPGPANAITDVAGVEVGHATIIEGEGRLVRGEGPVRTGVTAILPRGQAGPDSAFAAWFTLNGNGEMTGTVWLEESGMLETPVLITNTHSVGVVRDATVEWLARTGRAPRFSLPVVAETFDGALNDDLGFHVRREHAFEALDGAVPGAVIEGNVGGGTGMICHGFKGGIGTASRRLEVDGAEYTLGVLVQCNYGSRRRFRVDGVPVGEAIPDLLPCVALDGEPAREAFRGLRRCEEGAASPEPGASAGDEPADGGAPGPVAAGTGDPGAADGGAGSGDGGPAAGWPWPEGTGSIIVVVATDAPLLPHQLKRVAKRASLGVGRMGGLGENSSGDIFIAFTTGNREGVAPEGLPALHMIPNGRIDPFFEATVQATEEAILNAMLAAETMTGADGIRVYELPHDRLLGILRAHGRLD